MEPRFDVPPAPTAAVERLVAEAGVLEPTAQVLVRRGMTDPEDVRRFLGAAVRHELHDLPGVAAAADRLLHHVEAGGRIVVHGDYDCDGVCATAILVRALRQLGADATWFLPHRVRDGYGLGAETVRRLAAAGTALVVTVDCGITAVDEVELARGLGMEVVITDHHRPRADGALPDTAIVHPGLPRDGGAYANPDLCGAGVAWRLAAATLEAAGHDPAGADLDLDLVCLATVADVVALQGENRGLVRDGLERIADSRRPGLRALLDVASTSPADVDATAVAFRLAPRINAAGRVGAADPGVELLLCADEEEAGRLALRLDAANRDRREVEARILREAEAQAREQGEVDAYVLAGEDWHPGVVGIVASRIVEAFGRPAVLLAAGEMEATGSGRSVPGFDLLAGLDACAGHLLRHGGHRAAAGCGLRTDAIPAFRAAFQAYATANLDPEALRPTERVDAVVGGGELGLALAEDLARLGPFGQANPEPVLYVASGRAEDVRPLGAAGAHVAFSLGTGGSRIATVAFGRSELPVPLGTPMRGSYVLERHAFRSSVTPRLRTRELAPCRPDPIDRLDGDPVDAALAILESGPPAPPTIGATPRFADRSSAGAAAAIAALVASGEPVTVVCADAGRREAQLAPTAGGFALTDWWALARAPGALDGTRHLVALDPPTDAAQADAAARLLDVRPWRAWGGAELRFAQDAMRREHDLRPAATAVFRGLRDDGPTAVPALVAGDLGPGWWVGLVLRVLEESGAIRVDRAERVAELAAAPGDVRPLGDGPTHRAWAARGEERVRWLTGAIPAGATR